jgi:prevent-host-death family protein
MTTVTVHAAKTNLSKLLAQVEAGEEVVIMRGSTPVAKLVPIAKPVRRQRVAGRLAGKARLTEAFFEPLPPEELDAWGQ